MGPDSGRSRFVYRVILSLISKLRLQLLLCSFLPFHCYFSLLDRLFEEISGYSDSVRLTSTATGDAEQLPSKALIAIGRASFGTVQARNVSDKSSR